MSEAFYFAYVGTDLTVPLAWTELPISGGGVTGDASLATGEGNGLRIVAPECIVQVKMWCQFGAPGSSGNDAIAINLDRSAYGSGVGLRGQAQLLNGQTVLQMAYDGWLLAGALIVPMGLANTTATIDPSSYISCVVSSVEEADGGGGPPDGGGGGTDPTDVQWGIVSTGLQDHTERLAAPGGWIYRNTVSLKYQGYPKSMVNLTFAPEGGALTPGAIWQRMQSSPHDYTDRLRIPGGWLYRTASLSVDQGYGATHMSMVFVPG